MLLMNNMLCFSSLLKTNPTYQPAADSLFAALDLFDIKYKFILNTKDIWVRDFMPVKTRTGNYISFRYEPGYLYDYPELRTDYRKDVSCEQKIDELIYSDINLDGGNIVFSPSKEKAVISDRIFRENPVYRSAVLVRDLEKLLQTRIIIIPSLQSDLTGHADGMVRFVDEHTAIGNSVPSRNGLEQRIKLVLKNNGIDVIDFPYYSSPKGSACGCYLNFLETDKYIFFPVFAAETDEKAISTAKGIFSKTIVPVNINEIAREGGLLNCISWEMK